jgi:hypothetical protein
MNEGEDMELCILGMKRKKFQILKVINTSQVYLQPWMNEPLQTEKVGELSLSHSFSISKLVC